ncbi:MAG: hypothetical protein R3E13_07960 [Alphaproteobacteria bacterium]
MEFVSKDADMILVKTNPEELQKLAAIMRACHDYDPVLCEMDSDDLLSLANRLEKADQDSWVFHALEILYLHNILLLARIMDHSKRSSIITQEDVVQLHADIENIDQLRHKA